MSKFCVLDYIGISPPEAVRKMIHTVSIYVATKAQGHEEITKVFTGLDMIFLVKLCDFVPSWQKGKALNTY